MSVSTKRAPFFIPDIPTTVKCFDTTNSLQVGTSIVKNIPSNRSTGQSDTRFSFKTSFPKNLRQQKLEFKVCANPLVREGSFPVHLDGMSCPFRRHGCLESCNTSTGNTVLGRTLACHHVNTILDFVIRLRLTAYNVGGTRRRSHQYF